MINRAKTSSYDQLSLAFELYKRIPQSNKITAKELQSQLSNIGIERDIRTIQRNLDVIIEYFDVDKDDRDKPYGYSRRSNNILTIGPQEAILLSLAETYLKNLLPTTLLDTISNVFRDAKHQLFPSYSNEKERQWLKKVRFVSETQPLQPPAIDRDIFEKLSIALYQNRWLTVHYTNANNQTKNKKIMPLGLAQQGSRLYLVCRFHGYNNERILAVHRIYKAALSTFTFNYPPDFSLEQFDAQGRFGFGEGDIIALSFGITHKAGQHLRETPLSSDQQVIEHADHFTVTATVNDTKQLERWLNSFGDDVFNIQKQSLAKEK